MPGSSNREVLRAAKGAAQAAAAAEARERDEAQARAIQALIVDTKDAIRTRFGLTVSKPMVGAIFEIDKGVYVGGRRKHDGDVALGVAFVCLYQGEKRGLFRGPSSCGGLNLDLKADLRDAVSLGAHLERFSTLLGREAPKPYGHCGGHGSYGW